MVVLCSLYPLKKIGNKIGVNGNRVTPPFLFRYIEKWLIKGSILGDYGTDKILKCIIFHV